MKGSVYIYTIFSSLLLLFPAALGAQTLEEEVQSETMMPEEHAFIVDAQVRSRGEYRNGAIIPRVHGETPSIFVLERARLSLGYASNGVQLQISGQQAGLWGQQGMMGASNGLSLNEAWGQINTRNHLFAAKVGRQSLSYDNGRILGNNDWTPAGNSHNALRLSYEDEWHKLHIVGAISQNRERLNGCYYNDSTTNLYKNMAALWYHFGNISFPLQASVLFLNEGHETGSSPYYPSTVYMQTMGGNVAYSSYHFGAELEGYYQMGTNASKQTVKAWMAAASLRFTINNQWTLKGGFDYISGTKNKSAENNSFAPNYSSYHNFHGGMQYFGSYYLQKAKNSGLMDAHGELTWSPRTNLDVMGAYHYFSTAAYQMRLSHEVDININWRIRKDVNLSAGYSFALNTKNMFRVLGGNNEAWQDFGYLQLNISPRILFHKW